MHAEVSSHGHTGAATVTKNKYYVNTELCINCTLYSSFTYYELLQLHFEGGVVEIEMCR